MLYFEILVQRLYSSIYFHFHLVVSEMFCLGVRSENWNTIISLRSCKFSSRHWKMLKENTPTILFVFVTWRGIVKLVRYLRVFQEQVAAENFLRTVPRIRMLAEGGRAKDTFSLEFYLQGRRMNKIYEFRNGQNFKWSVLSRKEAFREAVGVITDLNVYKAKM